MDRIVFKFIFIFYCKYFKFNFINHYIMIKIKNNRKCGSLFHYAHFICDCLFTEIVNDIYNFKIVYREKTLSQTIGILKNIYEEVMGNVNIELPKKEYDELNLETTILGNKENYLEKEYFIKFRNYIFTRYNINETVYDINYPEIVLIERGARIELIDDAQLQMQNTNITTGKERREIKDIENLKTYFNENYKERFKTIILEKMPFKEQIKYFNNAKIIICAHGAAMSNMLFCKKGTIIIEVTCNIYWKFFNDISSNLELLHYKCIKNNYNEIIDIFNNNNLVLN